MENLEKTVKFRVAISHGKFGEFFEVRESQGIFLLGTYVK